MPVTCAWDFRCEHSSLIDILNLDCILGQDSNETGNETDHNVSNNQDGQDSADQPTASFKEDSGDTDDSPMSVEAHVSLARTYRMPFTHSFMRMNSNWSIIERTRARNMKDLATELDIPQLLNILRRFLQSQLQDDDRDPEDVPLDECPFYDGSVCVYHSASSTFYAPSDVSGLHGMRRKHIRCSPMWRNEGPRYDCVFVVTNPHAEGMLGLDVAHVLCFFFIQVPRHHLSVCGHTLV